MTQHILALDLATKTGFAHSSGYSGVWLLKKAHEPASARLRTLFHTLGVIHNSHPFETLVAEDVHSRFINATKSLCELRGVAILWCNLFNVKFIGDISAKTIKKHATGNGNASKDRMIHFARLQWNTKAIHDDNEADALHLLDYYKLVVDASEKAL